MSSRKVFGIASFAGTLIAALAGWTPGAISGSHALAEQKVQYQPLQSISHHFGSKSMNGYFVQHGGNCVVTLMVLERSDREALLPATPTRVRLLLYPGQVAGLDSEEGRSLNFTCGDRAARLFVDIGGTNGLIALQELSLEKVAAQAR